MTSIIVTGISGAVGTALGERLSETEHDIVGVDASTPRWNPEVRFRQTDLTGSPRLPDADVVVHLAAHSRVRPIVETPTRAFENVSMLESVLEHARSTGAAVIVASSREVYGNAIRPAEDDLSVDDVENPYGASKVACESLCAAYHRCYDVPVTRLRFANVYGRYDANPRVIPLFIALATAGKELSVYGRGKLLDFVYVDDVLDAILAAIDRRAAVAGEAINVGSGVGTPLSELAERIARRIDACPGYRIESSQTSEVARYISDISKARTLLDVELETHLEEGLGPTIDWYRDRPELLAEMR